MRDIARDRVLLGALAGIAVLAALLLAPTGGGAASAIDPPLIVADLRGHALVVVDPHDPTGARRIPLPGGPHELVRLPDGRVAVTLEQSGRIALVDLDRSDLDRSAVEVLEVGGLPHGIDTDGDVLYVTDRAVDAVRRFNLAGWQELPPLAAGAWPHSVRVLETGETVVANAMDDTLRIGGLTVPASALPETVAVDPAGRRIATAGAYGGQAQVFALDGTLEGQWDLGGRPVRVAYGADGTLAVALSAAGAVVLIDDHGYRSVHVGGVPDGLAFSPDGRRVYVGDVHGGVVSAVHVDSGRVLAQFVAGESAGALLFTR